MQLLEEKNYQIIRVETKTHIRKKNSGKHRDGDVDSYKIIICKCPTEGCTETIKIARERDLRHKCKSCSAISRLRGENREYKIYTTDIQKSHLPISKKYKEIFLREEVSLDGKAYVAVFKCPKENCQKEIRLRNREKIRECHSCCRKALPYERTYNQIKSRRREKSNGHSIQWLLTFEDFVSLCEIPNCHYCNSLLNRAKYKAEEGSTASMLDRKDSNKDYTLDNVVPCCPTCNFTKNEHISYDEMVLIMKHRGLWIEKRHLKIAG